MPRSWYAIFKPGWLLSNKITTPGSTSLLPTSTEILPLLPPLCLAQGGATPGIPTGIHIRAFRLVCFPGELLAFGAAGNARAALVRLFAAAFRAIFCDSSCGNTTGPKSSLRVWKDMKSSSVCFVKKNTHESIYHLPVSGSSSVVSWWHWTTAFNSSRIRTKNLLTFGAA